MSGLLVKSVMVMEENLKEMNALDVKPPIVLGGAALSRHYCESHLKSTYDGDVYYGKDAFDGLRVCNLIAAGKRDDLQSEISQRLDKRAKVEIQVSKSRERIREGALLADGDVMTTQSPIKQVEDVEVPELSFLGSRVVENIPLTEILPFMNEVSLFRGQWGFKRAEMTSSEYEAHLDEVVRPVFQRLSTELVEKDILDPKAVYGWFECQSDGDDLIVYDPEHPENELERFTFPRQERRNRRCISDFFKSIDTGKRDVVGFHCVTMGDKVSQRARVLFEENEYQEYLFVHGFGVECAEALAELWHKRMRAELGIGTEDSPRIRELFSQQYRGSRYSFGYPACPDMSDQEKLFRLLKPERIGCRLTENWQIDPEQSTSAIIVHHPEARYFNV